MRITSKPRFLLGAVCILPIIHECRNYGGTTSALWVGFFLYMMLRCFYGAFRKNENENEKS